MRCSDSEYYTSQLYFVGYVDGIRTIDNNKNGNDSKINPCRSLLRYRPFRDNRAVNLEEKFVEI